SLENNIINRKHTSEVDKNEIGKVTHEINEIIENLKDATEFVTAIGEGKLDMDYQQTLDLEYTPGKNKLADSLIEMQKKLKTLNEDERKRQWANEGITKFVEIMRSSNDNLQTLGDSVVSTLVQYTNSNQGALYILNDEDQNNKYLELISLFAFDIKKYEQRKIKLGEGILGQTFLEKELTYITNMPEEYIRITSGLGDANPKSLLLFPLKVDRDAYGIIELASFNEYASHEISFVETLGESIAATLSSVKAAQKNRQLIEQFQQQTEEMRAQEEEMRQNMEEMQATQEEVGRKEQAYLARIATLEKTALNSVGGE
ncbi:MAG TPA: GAF domain-containing protein, partial [Chryseolinea sp.]|nr:GAF domain-containing protein [Chryseolinea sp.]